MKTDFKFSNLLGTVYTRGNLLFTPDGKSLLSPVGNRVTIFDIENDTSTTLNINHRRNISRLALNPRGNLLLTVDEDGRAILTHLARHIPLYHFSLRSPPTALSFSPSGRHFAVGLGRDIEVWRTPDTPDQLGADGELEFAPFVKHRTYHGHYDDVKMIEWSTDGRFFVSGSKDHNARIWSLDPEGGFVPTTLVGHRQGVMGAWFSKDQETIYTVSKDGALFQWKYQARDIEFETEEEEEADARWRIVERHYFMQNNANVTCAAFHAPSNFLVVGFSSGMFVIYELPNFIEIQKLSISQNDIDNVCIDSTGLRLAFGASKLGQLLVWEWQMESYRLKQQGHFDSTNAIAYSPDGSRIVTCADDGKIKVWDTRSGFHVLTFTEHTSGVTACEYAKRGNVLFTASLDGSVRAWDLIRYRNFRTFTAPTRLSWSSLAVDPSGEVVAAGSLDSFDIHIWSVQTGQLLDRLTGHEGPVSSLTFDPNGGALVSGSWDRTVRIWSIFSRTQTSEPLQLQADVLSVTLRPDGKQLAVSTLDGQLTFWNVSDALQTGTLDARRDASGGRRLSDRRTAANAAGTKAFTTVTYSGDGTCVLAAGRSKYICLYDVQSGVLLKKYTVSVNLSLDGTQEFLNSKNLTTAGPAGLIDTQGEASDLEDRIDRSLPGASRGDPSYRRTRPEVRVSAVAFSPTGRAFCAAGTEGLLIYSIDQTLTFDPIDLSIDITPASTFSTLHNGSYAQALAMAFSLSLPHLTQRVYEGIPVSEISLVVKDLPVAYLHRLITLVVKQTEKTQHLEFHLRWIEAIMSRHGRYLKEHSGEYAGEMRGVQRVLLMVRREVERVAEGNLRAVEFLLSQPVNKAAEGEVDEEGQATDGADEMEVTWDEERNGESDGGEWLGLD